MAARVDDDGTRQDGGDQTDVAEIIGQLVGEVRPSRAQRRRLLEIAPAERGELREGCPADRFRIAIPARRQIIELRHHGEDILQLHGALHLRVTRQDLLEQRRAGARQADDEDRRGTWVAAAAVRRKEAGIEECANARAAPLEHPDVERLVETAQGVALSVVHEGLRVRRALLEGLAERKLQLRLVGPLPLVARQQPLHFGDLRIAEDIILQVREAPPSLGPARVRLQRRLVGRLALGAPAQRLLQVPG